MLESLNQLFLMLGVRFIHALGHFPDPESGHQLDQRRYTWRTQVKASSRNNGKASNRVRGRGKHPSLTKKHHDKVGKKTNTAHRKHKQCRKYLATEKKKSHAKGLCEEHFQKAE